VAKARKHFDFDEIEEYLRNKTYPFTIPLRDYGSKSNFGRVQVCDSLRTNLISISKKCLKSLFQPLVKNGKLEVTFLPVDKQTDGFNCLFALGYASILLDGKSPVDAQFVVNEMRSHFMKCLNDVQLYPFPTLEKTVDVSSNKPKFFIF